MYIYVCAHKKRTVSVIHSLFNNIYTQYIIYIIYFNNIAIINNTTSLPPSIPQYQNNIKQISQ